MKFYVFLKFASGKPLVTTLCKISWLIYQSRHILNNS